MPVSDDIKLIFIHIPKNAGTSIYKEFFDDGSGRGAFFGHHKWQKYNRKIPGKWRSYTTFSVVRNPWDRVVSNYVYARKEESYWHSAKNPGKSKMGKHFDYDTLKNKSFSEAVNILDELEHQGWGYQHPYICDNDLNIKVDYVLRMENLDVEMKEMFDRENISVDYNMSKKNVTREDKNYREWYDKETQKKVEKYYKKDIEIFNYSF